MEQIIFYMLIFCIGTVFGSFFTLAIYRIPLHQDITHKRSYCPKCNHKLNFFDMIPIISYICLGGKCRYCKQKIRIRYLFLELLTGILFTLFAISLNFNFYILEISKIVYFIFGLLYIVGLIIIAGIDKEKHEIQKSVILYEIIVISIYMIYLYTVEQANIYRYVIYLFVVSIFLFLDNQYLKKKLKDNYTIQIIELSIIMSIFSQEIIFIFSVILALLTIIIKQMIKYLIEKKDKVIKKEQYYYKNLPIGFYLCFSNIIVLIVINMLACRR